MVPMSSPDRQQISDEDRWLLLDLAQASIRHGLDEGGALPVRPEDHPERLRVKRATFVTLDRHHQLRGCIGHLEAIQSLVEDVAENAWSAAFRDPRFPPLLPHELAGLKIHISVLTPPEPVTFTDETDLLQKIRPGLDGLILKDGLARGTFLPSVWESLPTVDEFWFHLKRKAGLPGNHWSDTLEVSRYTTESFPEE
jgi:AmmeMemoRadiSam system protein A